MSKKREGLQIEEDITFQRKEWMFQRIGVAVLSLFVVAAVLGLTGLGGPLSRGDVGDSSGALRVEYERFVRRGTFSKVILHLHGAPGAMRFWVGASYFERAQIDSVAPVPELVSVESNRHVYEIRTGSEDVTVILNVKHEAAGRLDADVGLVDGPSVRFSQLSIF